MKKRYLGNFIAIVKELFFYEKKPAEQRKIKLQNIAQTYNGEISQLIYVVLAKQAISKDSVR
ncbi:MAG: hypothetical protein LBP41_02890 [Holosporaceae bacterium]|jgi:hypothetical protein|nr:hypothetical protein [Holosporaceae bacterium]